MGSQSHQNLKRRGRRGGGMEKYCSINLPLFPLLFKSTLPPLPTPYLPRPRPLPRIALPWTTAFSSLFSYTSCHYLLFTSSWILLQYSICISTSSSVFLHPFVSLGISDNYAMALVQQWGKQCLFFSFSISSTSQLKVDTINWEEQGRCDVNQSVWSIQRSFFSHCTSWALIAPTVNKQLWARALWCRSKRRMFLSKLFPTLQHPSFGSTIVFANAYEQEGLSVP